MDLICFFFFKYSAVADGDYSTTGWARLFVQASDGAAGSGAFLAGCLEGYLTHDLIWGTYLNLFENWGFPITPNATHPQLPEPLETWLRANMAFTESLVRDPSGDHLEAVAGVFSQFKGLVRGYNQAAPPSQALSDLQLWTMNSAGDMEDLVGQVKARAPRGAGSRRGRQDAWRSKMLRGVPEGGATPPEALLMTDCSALIKLTDDGKDVVAGHTTWRSYTQMSRVFKVVTLGEHTSTFSSTPSFLSSKDDYYATSAGLVVMETTNNVFNETLFDLYLTPKSLLTWVRTIAANRLASNGQAWAAAFELHNSGTYNNQWMVLDLKGDLSQRPLPAGTLWIAEQIPGRVASADVSDVLSQQGYWGSYNIPYLKEIFDASGYPAMVLKFGDSFSYTGCPRARIFARDAAKAGSVAGIMRLMQYCGYPQDPLSLGSPGNCISSRYDLTHPASGSPPAFGGIDSKVTSGQLARNLSTLAINGPTHSGQPVFTWNNATFAKLPHNMMPSTFDFEYTAMHQVP